MTVVVHAANQASPRTSMIERAKKTWLRGIQNVIVDGGGGAGSHVAGWDVKSGARLQRRRTEAPPSTDSSLVVSYPDSPGCTWTADRAGNFLPERDCADTPSGEPSTFQIGAYRGAHRTTAGILWANDTWPDTAWTVVLDDDNMMVPSRVADWLLDQKFDPDVPLLLSSRLGPGRNRAPCFPSSAVREGHWGCCSDAKEACRSFIQREQPSAWAFNASAQSFVRTNKCDKEGSFDAYCCRSEPWAYGERFGFPYRASPKGELPFSFIETWPYGGESFIISRGMLNAISREHWTNCLFRFQCANADHRVMTCILNAGFSATQVSAIPTIDHHVRPPNEDNDKCYAHHSFDRDDETGEYFINTLRCLSKEQVRREEDQDLWRLARPPRDAVTMRRKTPEKADPSLYREFERESLPALRKERTARSCPFCLRATKAARK